jgi:hypothetical protein
MSRVAEPFAIQHRSKKDKSFILTINYPCSGLPQEICRNWQRRSFSRFPPELSAFYNPPSKSAAKQGARALIEFLKKEVSKDTIYRFNAPLLIGDSLVRFVSLDNNPRAERLVSDGVPYSPNTIAVYKVNYSRYIKGDPFLKMDINAIDVPTARAFLARVGMKKTKDGRLLAGTKAFKATMSFMRMAFREY